MKMPSLVRRMSVQAAREESLQVRGPRNKFEKRILEELPKAIKRVEEFYGIKLGSVPPIVISRRQIRADADALISYLGELRRIGTISQTRHLWLQKEVAQGEGLGAFQKIASAIKDIDYTQFHLKSLLRPRAWYNAPLAAISIPPERSIRFNESYLLDLLTHELSHHLEWEQRSKSKIYDFRTSSSSLSDGHLASMCASEGLATYSESWVHKEPKKGILAKIKRELFSAAKKLKQAFVDPVFYPDRWFAEFAHSLMFSSSMLLEIAAKFCREHIWKTDEKFAKAVKKSFFARTAVDQYSDGLEFVRQVADHLGTAAEAFKLITQHPPQSMEEVLVSETYFARMDSEIPKIG